MTTCSKPLCQLLSYSHLNSPVLYLRSHDRYDLWHSEQSRADALGEAVVAMLVAVLVSDNRAKLTRYIFVMTDTGTRSTAEQAHE